LKGDGINVHIVHLHFINTLNEGNIKITIIFAIELKEKNEMP